MHLLAKHYFELYVYACSYHHTESSTRKNFNTTYNGTCVLKRGFTPPRQCTQFTLMY